MSVLISTQHHPTAVVEWKAGSVSTTTDVTKSCKNRSRPPGLRSAVCIQAIGNEGANHSTRLAQETPGSRKTGMTEADRPAL